MSPWARILSFIPPRGRARTRWKKTITPATNGPDNNGLRPHDITAAGAMVGGMKTRQNRRAQAQAQQQATQQQDAAYNQKRSEYDRAFYACLEGKGYTVK